MDKIILLVCCFLFFVQGFIVADDSFVYTAHTEGKGLGYSDGYTTLGVFSNRYSLHSFRPFIDGRVHCFNDGKIASNLGIVSRYFIAAWQKVVGGNLYYDYCNRRKDNQQIGIGFEFLGCDYDIRVNGYLPIGQRRRDSSPPTVITYPGGYVAKTRERHMALTGVDTEIGARLNRITSLSSLNLYGAMGSYYYTREFGKKIIGFRIRFMAAFSEYLSFEVKASYDNYFYQSLQGTLCLSFPFGIDKCSSKQSINWSSLFTEPVQRNVIIVNSRKYDVWKINW